MTNELSTKITNAIIRYFEEAGGDASELLEGLPYDRSYLTSPDNYVPAEMQATLIQRAEKLLDDPDFAYKVGHYSARPKVLGAVSVIARLFASPEKLYERAASLAGQLNRLLSAEIEECGPGECVIEVRASDADKWSKEACKQTKGVLEAVPTVFRLPLARVDEETCRVPIERAGKVDGHYYSVDEEGKVTAYSDEGGTQPVREVGKLDPDGSFLLGGVKYGAAACRYRIKYKPRPSWREKIKKALSRKSSREAYVEELERMNRELEKQFDEIQQRELIFRRLTEVGTAIVRQSSLDELLELVAWHVTEIAGAVVTRIFLIDEDGSIRQAPGAKAEGDAKHVERLKKLLGDLSLAPENLDFSKYPRIEEIIQNGNPTVFDTPGELFGPFWPEEVSRRLDKDGGIKKVAMVPLKSEEESVGFIFIASAGEIETEVVQLLANMAAQAIVNTRRMEEINRQKERLEKLREIQMKTAVTEDVGSLYAYLVEKARELTGSILVRMMFFDRSKKKVQGMHSSFAPEARPVLKSFRERSLLPDKNLLDVDERILWEKLCDSCRGRYVSKFSGLSELMEGLWPQEFSRTVDEEMGIKEVALTPLTRDNETIGVMIFASSRELDDDLLMMLTAQMSQLIKEAEYIRTIEEHRNQLDEKVKERTRQLEEANRELKESQSIIVQQEKMASLGQLAAGVAHELNNPLGYIQSNLHSMRDYVKDIKEYLKEIGAFLEAASQSPDGAVREKAVRVKDAGEELDIEGLMEDIEPLTADCLEGAERAKGIVLNLKNFSRPGETRPSLTDLNAGIESTISVVWNEIKYRAKLHKEYGDLPVIKGYPQKLNQVIMNLLVNAAHSIEEKGDIWIRTRRNNGFVEIEVEDNGKGIKEEHLSRIFDPFFTTKPVGKGTGLGLSISYGIVKEHGGEILVESRYGKGSKFTVRLPEDGVKLESAGKEGEVVR